ncbi:MAG: hypothetical protein RLZZ54_1139 [Cyanobacteriota bacterium]
MSAFLYGVYGSLDTPKNESMRPLEGLLVRLLRSAFATAERTTATAVNAPQPMTCHPFRLDDALGFKLLMCPLSARRG